MGENLERRGLESNLKCGRCDGFETAEHILWSCRFAKEAWEIVPLVSLKISCFNTVFGIAWHELHKLPSLPPLGICKGSLAAWLVWNLWLARNKTIFHQKWSSASEMVLNAVKGAREWWLAQLEEQTVAKVPPFRHNRPVGVVVCNVDAAWREDNKLAGFGWICRVEGATVFEGTTVEKAVDSPLVAEAMALREAVEAVLASGFTFAAFESDSVNLVKTVNGAAKFPSIHGIVEDIKVYQSRFNFFDVLFTPRSSNAESDSLTKSALRSYVNQTV